MLLQGKDQVGILITSIIILAIFMVQGLKPALNVIFWVTVVSIITIAYELDKILPK